MPPRARPPQPNIGGHHPALPSTPGAPEHGLGLAWDNVSGAFAWASMGGGGGGAPVGAQYLVLALDPTLTDERRFVPGLGLIAADGGAGADYDLRLGFASEANGDLIRRSGGAWGRLGIGSAGQVLTVSGGLPVWADPAVPAHSALSALAWPSSGHTGTPDTAPVFDPAGAAAEVSGSPGQVLGWDPAGEMAALDLDPPTGRCGWWPRAGLSLGSSYMVDCGSVRLARLPTFPIARTVALADSEYGWTWVNRTALSSANENTTTANALRLAHGATNTDWSSTYNAPARVRSFHLRPGMSIRVVGRIASNCAANYEIVGLLVYCLGAASAYARIGPTYAAGLKVYAAISGISTGSAAITIGQRNAGIWVALEIQRLSSLMSMRASYSTSVATTPPTPDAMTTLLVGAPSWATDLLYIGLHAQSGNVAGTLTGDVLYFDVDDRVACPQPGRAVVGPDPWAATQFDATSPTQWCGAVDLGSDVPAIDIAALRLDLASRVNLLPGDTATVQWSLVRSSGTGSPGAGSWYAAAALAESGSGRYLHLYCRITSTGDTQGSVWWGDSGPAVRAA